MLLCIIAASANANTNSEEERTPGGGKKQELVVHCYKIVCLNDACAQLVVPQLAPTPPNMVAGCCQYGMDFMGIARESHQFKFDNDGCGSAW